MLYIYRSRPTNSGLGKGRVFPTYEQKLEHETKTSKI